MKRTKKPCNIEWITIPAPDLDAAEKFYSETFGFEVTVFNPRYRVFKAGNLSGGLDQDLSVRSTGIGFSVTVTNLVSTLKDVQKHGGKLIKEPCSLGAGSGYCATILDPNGNQLEVYAANDSR